MKKNPAHAALTIVLRNVGKCLAILKYGLLEDGWLRITDLSHELMVFVGGNLQIPALVDIGLFVKTGDLAASIGAARNQDLHDFPLMLGIERPGVEIPVKVLEGLSDLLPATSQDDARTCLTCVCVNHRRKEAVATDGHLLLLKSLACGTKKSFMIDKVTLKVLTCFSGNVTNVELRQRPEEKSADNSVAVSAADFLTMKGEGWQLTSKVLPAKEYPHYQKVLPDRSNARVVTWDSDLQKELSAYLERAMPFTTKSHLIHFTAREGVIHNEQIPYFGRTEFSRDILPLQPEQVIGFNAEILQEVLRFAGGRTVSVTLGDSMLNPAIFQGDGITALAMPLKVFDVTRSELLNIESEQKGELKQAA